MSEGTLRRDAEVDEPGLVGARWWQDSVSDPIGRRNVILGVLAATTALAAGGVVVAASRARTGTPGVPEPVFDYGAGSGSGDTATTERRPALDLQRTYGWSFGAPSENLVFNGETTEPFDRNRLDLLIAELTPRVAEHIPFYVPTLFEAPSAKSTKVAANDPTPIPPLKAALRPIFTIGMSDAFGWAQAAGPTLAAVPGAALVVDLDGQDAVAFAAGASKWFDPVFLFDNWPHPRGVVPAHLTLAAAAYYQPLFARERGTPRDDQSHGAPPMFVLDRQRLAPYADSAEQFDNRWIARLPGAKALRAMGVHRILYVRPPGAAHELDDLNDDFVADHAAGIAITSLDVAALPTARLDANDVPVARSTSFSSGVVSGVPRAPTNFGSVPVAVGVASGALLGVAWSRSGSWNRGGSAWGGG